MIPDPIFTYIALAFVLGVVVGIGLCGAQVNRALRMATQARSTLQRAEDLHEQTVALYESAMRASKLTSDALRRLDGGRDA